MDLTRVTSSRRSTSISSTSTTAAAAAAAETRGQLEQSFDDSLVITDTQTAPPGEHSRTPVNDTTTSVYFRRDVVTYLITDLSLQDQYRGLTSFAAFSIQSVLVVQQLLSTVNLPIIRHHTSRHITTNNRHLQTVTVTHSLLQHSIRSNSNNYGYYYYYYYYYYYDCTILQQLLLPLLVLDSVVSASGLVVVQQFDV